MHFLAKNSLAFFCIITSYSACAWWDQGHQLTAEIAQGAVNSCNTPFLSLASRDPIQTLLNVPIANPGSVTLSKNTSTFTKSASWADSIKSYTKQGNNYADCHFEDVPITQLSSQISFQDALTQTQNYYAQNKHTYNSISCVKSAIKTLETSSASDLQKAIALRMVIHIVGDMSQPLHNDEYNNDMGGNNLILVTPVQISNTQGGSSTVSNLHFLWDATFGHFPQYAYTPEGAKKGIFSDSDVNTVVSEAKQMLNSSVLKSLRVNSYEAGHVSIVNWVADSYLLAQNNAYYRLPLTGKTNSAGLPYIDVTPDSNYYKNDASLIESCLYNGGIHLAKLLTAIFDPASAESGYVALVSDVANDSEVSLFPPT